MSTSVYYFRYPAYLVFSIDLVPTPKIHPQFFKSTPDNKLKSIRKTKSASKHYSSLISLGGCPYNTVYDEFFNQCVPSYMTWVGGIWIAVRYLLIWLVIAGVAYLIWYLYHGFITKKERSLRNYNNNKNKKKH
jgi:hypothetical protein